jgi:hypothetical protein
MKEANMTTAPDVDSLMKRTIGSWYEDGLADLTYGSYLLALGAVLLAQVLTPSDSPLQLLWAAVVPLVILLGGVGAAWVTHRLKSRLTYPRTGYISFERRYSGFSRRARIIAAVFLSAVISAGTVVASGRLANLSLVFGLVLCGAFAYLWQRLGLRRYLVVAVWCLLVGAALAPLPFTMEQGGAACLGLAGLGLGTAGLAAWRRFDRTAPFAEASDEGR